MKIKGSNLPKEVLEKVLNPDPLEGEDIIIEDEDGEILGVIIQPEAYDFFLRKVEEKEDEIDSEINEKYDSNAPTLDELMGD